MKKILCKILSVFIAALMVVSIVPFSALAQTGDGVETAGNVTYYTKGGERIGIKQVAIDDYTYYDVTSNGIREDIEAEYLKDILSREIKVDGVGTYSILENWAYLAGEMFERGGKYTCKEDYSERYSNGVADNPDYGSTDVAKRLSSPEATSSGSPQDNNYATTGLCVTNSLDSLRHIMTQHITDRINRYSLDEDEVFEMAAGVNPPFPQLSSKDEQTVLYNILTSIDETSSCKFKYFSYGIAFYDFDLMVIADPNLEYVSEAEPFKGAENPIEEAAKAGVKGVLYTEKNDEVAVGSTLQNQDIVPVDESFSVSFENSESVSTSVSNSEHFEYGQMIGSSTEFGEGLSGIVTGIKETLNLEFSFGQAFENIHTKEETSIKSESGSREISRTLAPHTVASSYQVTNSGSMTVPYNTPCALTFKVAIFDLTGDVYADGWLVSEFSTACYTQASMCSIFGENLNASDYNFEEGFYAYNSLHNKVKNCDVGNWDATYGNNYVTYEYQVDGKAPEEKYNYGFEWDDIKLGFENATGISLEDFATHVPLLPQGATTSVNAKIIDGTVSPTRPMYLPAKFRNSYEGQTNIIYTGGMFNLYPIESTIQCLNKYDVPYYDYIMSDGHWEVMEGSEGVISYDKATNYVFPVGEGTGYMKWCLNDSVEYTAEYEQGTVTSENMPAMVVPFSVRSNPIRESVSVSVVGDEFKGTVGDEPISVNELLTLVGEDENPIYDAYEWELEETTAASLANGKISFVSEEPIRIRAIVHKGTLEEFATDWLELTPREERNYVKAELKKTDFDLKKLLIEYLLTGTKIQFAEYDIASYIRYYDQYGDVWDGESEELAFILSNNDGASIDSNNILKLTKAGNFSLKVYDKGLKDPLVGTMKFEIETDIKHDLGDVDLDGYRTVLDATLIQKYLVKLVNDIPFIRADVNKDGMVDIVDATYIQRYVADLEVE